MQYRQIGKTNIEVSVMGLGCWPMAGMAGGANWSGIDDKESIATIQHAESLGINLLDTADGYGSGHSEEIIGRALLGRRDRYVIATKVGPNPDDPNPSRARRHILDACEASLRRLKTSYIDIYQLHCAPHEDTFGAVTDTMTELVEVGKIRCFGISSYETDDMRKLMHLGDLAMAQIGYSIVNPVGLDGLRFAEKHNLGTLIRVPLAQGALTGKYFDNLDALDDTDRRHDRFNNTRIAASFRKLSELRYLVKDGRRTMVQAALRFVLDTPGVTSAIPGAKDRNQLAENAGAVEAPPLTEEERRKALSIAVKAGWPQPPYTTWT